MRTRNHTITFVVAVIALVVAACGTTTSLEEQRAARSLNTGGGGGLVDTEDGVAGDDLSAIEPGADSLQGGPTSGSAGPATASAGAAGPRASGPSAGGGGGGSGAQSGAAGGGAQLTASAPGVTPTEIKIGLVYDKSAGYINAALGFGGVGQVDQKRAYDTLIADVNSRGGILGRKLVPVYHVFDSAGSDASNPPEVNEQKICSTFTENRVFVTFYTGTETFARCANKLGLVRIGSGAVDSQLLAESPLLVVLNVTLDRSARFTANRLAARGFFTQGRGGEKNVKVGLVRYDAPEFERAARALKEELSKQGVQLAGEVAIREAETVDQIQDETNATRAAALKFKSDGITNVLFLSDGRAYLELTFMQAAEKQLYRPRYGLSSTSGGQALATLLGNDARSQLAESLQVGWFPIFDVERAAYSGDNTSQAFRRCIQLLEQAGERYTEGDPTRNKEAISAAYCDLFNYLTQAGTNTGPDLTPQNLLERGVPSVDGMDSASTYALSTRQRRDAYGGVRDAKWVDDCACFRFESTTVHPV